MKSSKTDIRATALAEVWGKPLRVAAFCRNAPNQYGGNMPCSQHHYSTLVSYYPKWTFLGCYGGQKRFEKTEFCLGGFPQILADCKAGKFDLIFTNSLHTIAHNLLKSFEEIETLKSLNPPVGVYSEHNNFYTLQSDTDYFILIFKSFAKQESKKGKRKGLAVFHNAIIMKKASDQARQVQAGANSPRHRRD
ncbi:MAG: hypothetical protein LBJ12_09200 [Oscillospiraceae bacterium]|nr:hypothetical protein [Oscillospiraceae bacterium]